MISIKTQTKDIEKAIDRMNVLKKDMPVNMHKLLFDYRNKMAETSQRDYLSVRSSTTLGVVSGLLRTSIQRGSTIQKNSDTDMAIVLGSNVRHAPPWENGFTGTVQVPAHTRRVESRSINQRVFSWKSRSGTKKEQIAQGIAFVRAHSRHVDHGPRPFLRPAMEKHLPDFKKDLGSWRTYGEQ